MADLAVRIVLGAQDKTGAATRRARRGIDGISGAVGRLRNLTLSLLGGGGLAAFGGGALRAADNWQTLNNRIRTVAATQREANQLQVKLIQLSRKTGTEFDATVESYTRLQKASENLGRSHSQSLRVQETLNKAVVVGGSSGTEAAAGLRQFAQGLASNRLQGDELRSVLENLTGVSDALIVGLNKTGAIGHVTRGSLRRLAAEGKLTAEVLYDALLAAGEDVDAKYGGLNRTLGQSTTAFKTVAQAYLNNANVIKSTVGGLTDGLEFVTENFDKIAAAAATAAKVGLVLFARHALAASIANRGLIGSNIVLIRRLAGVRKKSIVATAALSSMTRAARLFQRTLPGLLATGAIYASIKAWELWGKSLTRTADKLIERLREANDEQRYAQRHVAPADREFNIDLEEVEEAGKKITALRERIAANRHQLSTTGNFGLFAQLKSEISRDLKRLEAFRVELEPSKYTLDTAAGYAQVFNYSSVKGPRRPGGRRAGEAEITTAEIGAQTTANFRLANSRLAGAAGLSPEQARDAARALAKAEYDTRLEALNAYAAQSAAKEAEVADTRIELTTDYALRRDAIDSKYAEAVAARTQKRIDDQIAANQKILDLVASEEQIKDAQLAARTAANQRAFDAGQISAAKYHAVREQLTAEHYRNRIAALRAQGALENQEQQVIDNRAIALEIERDAELQRIRAERLVKGRDAQNNALADYAKSAMDTSTQIGAALAQSFQGAETALADFVRTGKLNFSDLANSIINDLIKIAIRSSITGPLASAIGGFFAGGGGAAAGPTRAAGGPVSGGQSYLVGERGPEIFTPGASGFITPNHIAARSAMPGQTGAAANVRVVLNNRGASKTATATTAPDIDGRGMVVSVILDDLGRNGPIAQALSGANALQRRVA